MSTDIVAYCGEPDGLDAEIECPTLDATLPLSEIYRYVSFDSDESD